jgi:hypothetical protein
MSHIQAWTSVDAELRAMKQVCLEQAALCVLEESREGLKRTALDYRLAAEANRQAKSSTGNAPPRLREGRR